MQPAFLLAPVPEAVTALELTSVPSQLGDSWLHYLSDFLPVVLKLQNLVRSIQSSLSLLKIKVFVH